MTSLSVSVLGISVWGPGLEGWDASRPILSGEAPYVPRPSSPPVPALLSPTERRRAGPVVRLALAVAQEAAAATGLPPSTLHSVFASSHGDGPVVGNILEALAVAHDGRAVSPTQFHNSVHNAAAGYWSIAHGSTAPATCLGLHDASFAAGLLKAAVEAKTCHAPVLLCAYDHPLPSPLAACHPTLAPFGAGLVLAPEAVGTALARLELAYCAGRVPDDVPRDPALAELALGNPAGRALRLLEALARGVADSFPLPYGAGHLAVRLWP